MGMQKTIKNIKEDMILPLFSHTLNDFPSVDMPDEGMPTVVPSLDGLDEGTQRDVVVSEKPKASTPKSKPTETATPAASKSTTKQTKPAEKPNKTIDSKEGVVMQSFSHDWVDSKANMTLKNNTSETITRVRARLIYTDMKGEMLDYKDIDSKVEIEPGMSRKITAPCYGHDEHYAYYKSKTIPGNPERVYKVEFQLKGYDTK